jgi:glycosyltransferase involved in cell wall biosynthesis
MKVLRIIARLNVGGPARHAVWLSEGLRSANCETLLVSGRVPPGEDDMAYLAEAAGVRSLIFPEMSRELSAKDALTIWKLYRLMVHERPDIVHTHTAKAGATGRIAGLMYRWLTPGTLVGRSRACRLVHTYHGHVFHSYYGPLKTRFFLGIERLLARLATDRIVVVSEQQRREVHETFRVGRAGQFLVIPLGVDLKVYEGFEARRPRARAEFGARDGDVLVGIIGRLTEIKNHRMFLGAAALYRALAASGGSVSSGTGVPPVNHAQDARATDVPPVNHAQDARATTASRVRFIIIGDGRLRPELEASARELGVDDCVTFLGSRRDPENFYPALDVVALTSLNEGTPLTLIEAMANARPVISTAVGGVADLVGVPVSLEPAGTGYTICERGILVRPRDAKGFAIGLARLTGDDQMRAEMGRRGREFVLENHGKDRLLADVSALYDELLSAKPAKGSASTAKNNLQSKAWP